MPLRPPYSLTLPVALPLALALLALTACKTPEPELVGRPPAEQAVDTATRTERIRLEKEQEPAARVAPDPVFAAELWPFVEQRKTFRAEWDAPPAPLPVHEKPDPNSQILGEAVFERGEEIIWRGTWMAVYAPARYTAKRPVLMQGVRWTPDAYLTGDEHIAEKIGPGTPIEVYHYAGDGMCYMGLRGQILHGLCPTEASFRGHFAGRTPAQDFQPAQRIWWVRIVTPQIDGWIPLDNRALIDVLDE